MNIDRYSHFREWWIALAGDTFEGIPITIAEKDKGTSGRGMGDSPPEVTITLENGVIWSFTDPGWIKPEARGPKKIFEPTARVMPSGTVEEFCLKVRKSTPRAVYTFKRGDCEIFAKILVAAFGGEVKYDIVDGHAYALIDEKYYDITGQVEPRNELFDSWRG